MVTALLLGCGPAPRSIVVDPEYFRAGRDSSAAARATLHVAVLPLANYTPLRDAPERIGPMIAAELGAKPAVTVADAGAVQAALDQEPWLLLDRVPPDLVNRLGETLGVDALMVGSLLTYEYRDASGVKVPQVSLSLRLLECAGGRVLWSAVHSRDGNDSEWLFGFGRVHSLEQLGIEAIREMLANLPAPRWEARGDRSAPRGK
jgi:hypothetical protein